MTRLVLILTVLALAAGYSAAAAPAAEAHQDGCHRWHSCPSDTGSYVCGDLGYECQYPNYPTNPPLPGDDEDTDEGQYITKREFRRWAKVSIRDHFGDRAREFSMERCKRHSEPKMTCRVNWRWKGYWTSRLTIHEYAASYSFKFRR